MQVFSLLFLSLLVAHQPRHSSGALGSHGSAWFGLGLGFGFGFEFGFAFALALALAQARWGRVVRAPAHAPPVFVLTARRVRVRVRARVRAWVRASAWD